MEKRITGAVMPLRGREPKFPDGMIVVEGLVCCAGITVEGAGMAKDAPYIYFKKH